MLLSPRRTLLALVAILVLGTGLPALALGPVLLTVTGAVSNANRGPFDPATDKLFAFNQVAFDKAMEFDLDALQALPRATIRTDFPKGGPTVEFTGPLLADVLAAAGASGETVTIQAMDGYAVEIPSEQMLGDGAMVALTRDGKALGIGGLGPTQIVFPRAERPELKDMPDDWWIWQVFHISVNSNG